MSDFVQQPDRPRPSSPSGESRPRTAVDAVAEEFVEAYLRLSPLEATALGVPGRHTGIDDFSPEGVARVADLRRSTLARLAQTPAQDDVDAVTKEAMAERLGVMVERYEAGLEESELNNIASPLQGIRDTLDLMPTDTPDDWHAYAERLSLIPEALEGYHESLVEAAGRGRVSSQRIVSAAVEEAELLASDAGFFASLLGAPRLPQGELPSDVAEALRSGVREARRGYGEQAERLRDDILPKAPSAEGVGRDLYPLCSRYFLGTDIDLEETYAWGQEELARITADMAQTAQRVRPGASVQEAVAALDKDPAYVLHGTDELREWMQRTADGAIEALAGTHFDVPEPVRTIECCIAATNTGGIYYTGPSDDFSRPGRMWWSVPQGVTEFGTWREKTTVFHEGVPGHHLQIGQAVYRSDLLNSWRRLMSFTSGHGEGWALYAERLMEELGFLQDPADRLGWLDGQSMRAARVVLDIGVHCGFTAPDEVGGGEWTYEKAWAFLGAHANMPDGFLRFELDRYLGWPGQAPSYKIGERLWLALRDEVRAAQGADWNPMEFHRRALDLGGVGLDTLRTAILRDMTA